MNEQLQAMMFRYLLLVLLCYYYYLLWREYKVH